LALPAAEALPKWHHLVLAQMMAVPCQNIEPVFNLAQALLEYYDSWLLKWLCLLLRHCQHWHHLVLAQKMALASQNIEPVFNLALALLGYYDL